MQYQSDVKKSTVGHLNPITKLQAILVLGVGTLIFPNALLGFVIMIGLFCVAQSVGILGSYAKMVCSFGVPISIMLFFIQGFYSPKNKTIILDLGFARLGEEGLLYAAKVVVTLLVFLSTFYIMNKTTYPGKMVAALTQSGMHPQIGYLILASLNVVPQMKRRMDVIKEAQAARGVETSGSFLIRLKAYLPLMGPVVLSSLTDAQERGMTLETRGFANETSKWTSLISVQVNQVDKNVRLLLWVFLGIDFAVSLFMRFS